MISLLELRQEENTRGRDLVPVNENLLLNVEVQALITPLIKKAIASWESKTKTPTELDREPPSEWGGGELASSE